MNATAVEIAKLSLAPGDALVVMTPKALTVDQRYAMTAMLRVAAGYSVPIAILDGGVTLATVSKVELSPGAKAVEPAVAEEPTIVRRRDGAPFKELLEGVETQMSIVAYKLWLKGEGAVCEHAYRPDRFGPAGQYICQYCRDVKRLD